MPVPPASFEYLVFTFKLQAEMQMGLFPPPEGETAPTDFRLARHFIDLLAMLQEKTKGNLSLEEARNLENSLTELRFRYVQKLEESRQAKSEEAPPPPANE